MFNKPKALQPEDVIKTVLDSATKPGFRPENIAKAIHKKPSLPQRQPDPPKSGGSTTGSLVNAAVWAYGQWSSHQKSLSEQERALLDLAHQKRGWFTHAEAVRVVGRGTVATIERLKEAGLVEQMNGKNNQPVYVVAQFLPPTVVCSYCQAIYDAGETSNCSQCGAVLSAD